MPAPLLCTLLLGWPASGAAQGQELLQVGLGKTRADAASPSPGSAMGNTIPLAGDCEHPEICRAWSREPGFRQIPPCLSHLSHALG